MTTILDTADRRARLVDDLTQRGHLRSPRWKDAFNAVARETFVRRFWTPSPDGLVEHDLTSDDTASALDAVYFDTTLITQFDAGGTATSSSTTPSLMASMLEHLDAHPGHHVLEVGTGTGYNAALLCHALGAETVTTLDIHRDLVDLAADQLGELGYVPLFEVADGRDGAPQHGPYDRIIATCGFGRVPAAWMHQVRPGGIILANLGFGLVRLVVDTDRAASGPFVDPAAFMSHRPAADHQDMPPGLVVDATEFAGTGRSVQPITDLDEPMAAHLRALAFPHLRCVTLPDGERRYYDTASSEGFRVSPPNEDQMHVIASTDYGYYMWERVAFLVHRWQHCGRPDMSRYGMTITPDGAHHVWLDEPSNTFTYLL